MYNEEEKKQIFSGLEEEDFTKTKRTVEDMDYIVELMGKWERQAERERLRPIEDKLSETYKHEAQELREYTYEDIIHTFPKYCPVKPQEMVVYKKGQMEKVEKKVPIDFGLTTSDKLRVVGGVILAAIVGFGILKFSNMKDEGMFNSDGYNNYQGYVDYAKANGLPISQEGYADYMGYDYESNTIDIENSSRGGR